MDAILAPAFEATQMFDTGARKDAVAEANHRIANSLTLLVSMVRMQASAVRRQPGPFSAAEVRLMLDGVAARINTIAQLHRLLSTSSYEGATSLRPHLREVTDALVAALSSPDQNMRVGHSGQDCLVPTRQVQPVMLILCEVFINAMKYAHPAGVPLKMHVDCSSDADGRMVIAISDDGVGLPEGVDPIKGGGLGFRVIRSLAAEIGAGLDVESCDLGVTFRLSLPTTAMKAAN